MTEPPGSMTEAIGTMTQPPATLGQRLKAEREKKGLSTQKAADELHLDGWVVDALEDGDYARIGPAVYAKGHLKRYAALLGLPAAEILDAYNAQAASPATGQTPGLRLGTSSSTGSETPWTQMVGLAIVAVIVAGVVWWKPWQGWQGSAPGAVPPSAAGGAAAGGAAAGAAASAAAGPDGPTAGTAASGDAGAAASGGVGAEASGDVGAEASGDVGAEAEDEVAAAPPRATSVSAAPTPSANSAPKPSVGAMRVATAAAAPATGNGSGAVPATGNGSSVAPATGKGSSAVPATGNGSSAVPATGKGSSAVPVGAGAGHARLRLSFSADAWVDVHDATGQRLYAGNGRANSVKTLSGEAPLRVYLKSTGGVQLQINDRAVAIGQQFVTGDSARFEAGADGVLRRESRVPAVASPMAKVASPHG
jgi:cytoskeleton protein RodZ